MKYRITVYAGVRISEEKRDEWGIKDPDRLVWATWDKYPEIEATDEIAAGEAAINLSRMSHPECHGFVAETHDRIQVGKLVLPGNIDQH